MVLSDNVNSVLEVFNNYYGEDKVDLVEDGNDFNIIVWFPTTRVTNEDGNSVDVFDIFIKIPITENGRLKVFPTMARATFTYEQAISGYRHSHCSLGFPNSSDDYGHLCFGTGPINRTMSSLFTECDESLWTLFCGELDLYVKTESLAGVPYIRMSSIGAGSSAIINTRLNTTDCPVAIKRFIKWFLRNRDIPFVYSGGVYKPAMTSIEFTLCVSEAAFEYNHHSYGGNNEPFYFTNVIVKNGRLYNINRARHILDRTDLYVTFKGRRIPVTVTGNMESEIATVPLVNSETISCVLGCLFKLVNCVYGKSR